MAEREEEIVVIRNGKPAAVLVNYDEYERLKNTLDVLSDPGIDEAGLYARGRQGQSFEAVFDESLVVRKRRKRKWPFIGPIFHVFGFREQIVVLPYEREESCRSFSCPSRAPSLLPTGGR